MKILINMQIQFGLMVTAILLAFSMPTFANGVSGSAAGGTLSGANSDLESCSESLGTLAVHEDKSASWWRDYNRRYPTLGSTLPLLRLMAQQSNCFVVVERGKAMKEVIGERELEASGEMRGGSNFGKGQMVAADYTMSPEIQFSENTGGTKGKIFGSLGSAGKFLDQVTGSLSKNEAGTTLLLIDNRSTVQVAAAAGSASKFNFGAGVGIFARNVGADVSGYTRTPEGKVIAAAFADSFNHMVRALRNYSAQNVAGGLGKGGKLEVGQ